MPIDSRPGRTILGGDPLPSLKTMARKVLQTNLSLLESVGDAPFSLVESVLSQCGAVQLATIELASPHLKKDSKRLWKHLALKDFFEVRKKYDLGEMKEPSNWRKVYLAAQDARQEKEASSRARLRDSYASADSKRQEKKLVYVPTLKADPKKNRHWSSSTTHKAPRSLLAKARAKTISYAQTVNPKLAASSRSSATSSRSSRPTAPLSACQPTTSSNPILPSFLLPKSSASLVPQPSSHPAAPIYRPTVADTPLMASSRPTNANEPRFTISARNANKSKPPSHWPPLEERKEEKKAPMVDFFGKKGGAASPPTAVVVTKSVRNDSSASLHRQQSPPSQSSPSPAHTAPIRAAFSPPTNPQALPTSRPSQTSIPPPPPSNLSAFQISPPQPTAPPVRKKEPTSLFIPRKKMKTT